MTTRRLTSSYVLVLLVLAVFIPLSPFVVPKSNALTINVGTAVPNVSQGSPPITVVSPAINVPGTTVTLTGSGWNASRSCSITVVPEPGSGSAFFITGTSCSINGNGQLSGTFTVAANSQAGLHHLWVNDTSTPSKIVGTQVPFTVVPTIVTSPGAAVAGSPVAVYGSGFNGTTAATCTISGTPVPSGPPNATCAENQNGILQGLFIVRNVAIGFYIITADDTVVSALAPFTLTGSPTAPVASFTPAFGPTGTFVTITGSNWNPSDTSVSFNETTFTSIGPLSITPVICPVSGGIIGACSFTVRADALGGTHIVNATGTLGDKFALQFIVLSTFVITPDHGKRGDSGTISGSGYLTFANGTSCINSIFASILPTFNLTATPAVTRCQVSDHGVLTGTYQVALNALGGLRSVSIINATLVQQGQLTVFFTVTATVIVVPSSGRAGANILVSGSNFAGGDTSCTLTTNPANLLSSVSCSVSGGIVSASFIVASGASGPYNVTVTGTTGDSGSALFTAALSSSLAVNPTNGQIGTLVAVTGSNYLGTSCIITATPSSLFSSQSCSIAGGVLTGSFSVALGASPGTAYTVGVQTNAGPADSATTTFTVNAGPTSTLVLTPNIGPVGTVVSGHSPGFPTDTSCILSSSPSGLLGSPSCSVNGGNVTVGFEVSSGAGPGSYVVTVIGNTGRSASASFTVNATALFTLSANPSSIVLGQGGAGSVTITILSSGGFHAPVTLTASVLPAGVTAGFSPNPATPPSGGSVNSVLAIAVASNAPSTTISIPIIGMAGTAMAATSVTLVIQATVTTITTSTTSARPCIIATATFGSEVSPAVQFLRGFRDNLVLKTRAGSAFMEVFNAWYYSFSPSVASFIAANDPIRAPIRAALYPLLGVLELTTTTYSLLSSSPEVGVVIAGIVASSLIGLVYLTLPALVGMRALMKRRAIALMSIARVSAASLAIALLLIAVGELAGLFALLAVGSSVVVLTCIIGVPTLAAFAVLRRYAK